ncbi:Uncharacterized protein FWK35_00031338 [Aphis craccivora]|uniref:Uncharacterized protein n=1 Tax=Aphis craccivora TaxID=307492 RepID=A0A6G0YF86_APHCR|nr:Uncharacterized protein FWK35_00031338 [Aphis craccivora]
MEILNYPAKSRFSPEVTFAQATLGGTANAGSDNTKNLKKKSKILDYFNKSEELNEATAHIDIAHVYVHNPQEV